MGQQKRFSSQPRGLATCRGQVSMRQAGSASLDKSPIALISNELPSPWRHRSLDVSQCPSLVIWSDRLRMSITSSPRGGAATWLYHCCKTSSVSGRLSCLPCLTTASIPINTRVAERSQP